MLVSPLFRDRAEAGRILARRLNSVVADSDVLVLALPRGGVPVGFEIAQTLPADLDILLVRKLGVPGQEELAMGAIAAGGVKVLNEAIIEHLRIPVPVIDRVTGREQREIDRREQAYREGRRPLPVAGRTVVLVDDGLATGASMLAAVRAVRARKPSRIIVAVPVASREACEEFQDHADDAICVETPEPFYGVGVWYRNFSQISDDEVQDYLRRASHQGKIGV
jgi:putative phosphoribosyl transferase